ncbi:hypothetical protein Plhal703r1_c37g0133091 [Plasmopara halstedii]
MFLGLLVALYLARERALRPLLLITIISIEHITDSIIMLLKDLRYQEFTTRLSQTARSKKLGMMTGNSCCRRFLLQSCIENRCNLHSIDLASVTVCEIKEMSGIH